MDQQEKERLQNQAADLRLKSEQLQQQAWSLARDAGRYVNKANQLWKERDMLLSKAAHLLIEARRFAEKGSTGKGNLKNL